jgi:hypothetical protein
MTELDTQTPPSPLEHWLQKKPLTTKNTYRYWIRRLFREMETDEIKIIKDAQKMEDQKGNIKLIWLKARNAADKLPDSGMRHSLNALKSYLRKSQLFPPEDPIEPRQKNTTEGYLYVDQVHAIILASEPPFNQIFRLMFRSYMGAREFLSFNSESTWKKILAAIENQQNPSGEVDNSINVQENPTLSTQNILNGVRNSIEIKEKPYFRFDYSHRKKNNASFYTLIPLKTLNEITEIMKKPKQLPFATKHGVLLDLGTPEDPRYLNSVKYLDRAFHEAVIRSKIETTSPASLHDLRDAAVTYASTFKPNPPSDKAVEFVMGHTIDPLGYRQCWRDEVWMWEELSKVNPSLDAKGL